MANRDWTPRRRKGRVDIYCSPACGAGCTYADFLRANRCAEKLAKALPGFEPCVSENLGWHFGADALGGLIHVSPGYKRWTGPWWVYANEEHAHAGNPEWGSFTVSKLSDVLPKLARNLRVALGWRQKFLGRVEALMRDRKLKVKP